ncbi:MAG: hypothetical protein HYT77_09855 [Deltaproteobacteria bacterium]|nr:hypothetical protein [Deltaproteobacteria bacterium]
MYRFHHGVAVLAVLLLVSLQGCGSSGTAGATRAMTGSVSASSLQSVRLKSPHQALTIKKATLACGDVSVCCSGYDGTVSVKKIGSDCSFTIDLPLESFCYCALFSGSDGDSNGCPDNYVASLGCSANSYEGAIPVFADDDNSTAAINLGSGDVQGSNVVSAIDICTQVDQDDDGIADSADTDDDGDGVTDAGDFQNDTGCVNADKFDSDGDNVPDIYESLWSSELQALRLGGAKSQLDTFFEDSDNDDVPDFCDSDFACTPDSEDTDGDCIPDLYDACGDDGDSDGVPFCVDCDDGDATSTVECYEDEFCAIDSDNDGFGLCDDCDDWDPDSSYECFSDAFCEEDNDADGFGLCIDCDDDDALVQTECYSTAMADFCEQDNDNDDFGICTDCDDFDPVKTTECYGEEACATDFDNDGIDYCDDCDDFDSTETNSFAEGCPVDADACETSACANDFECQLFADDNPRDEFETSNVQCNTTTGCCELKSSSAGLASVP